MRSKLQKAAIVAGLIAFSAGAQEPRPASKPPDKEKLSYALGMNLGLQIKESGVDADASVVVQAIKDVLENKPTAIRESDIRSILREAEATGRIKQSSRNIADGAAFLAKNAKEQGVTALPDGLQYRVLKTGTGELARSSDVLVLNFKGSWINGVEFKHNDGLEIPFAGCTKGLQEALLLMKVGSKWQIFIPYNLAYGRVGDRAINFGSALVYELELVSAESETAHPNQHHSSGRLGHSLDEDLLPVRL